MKTKLKRNPDRRIQRTRRMLHEALVALLHHKSYEQITIQQILDRANVGRSTFYAHFRDKDDLLVEGIRDILSSIEHATSPPMAKWPESLLWFSLPVFEHIDARRQMGSQRIGAHGQMVLHRKLQRVLVEVIARSADKEVKTKPNSIGSFPPMLLVEHIASTFTLVLNWWVEQKEAIPPKQVDALFRSLILPILHAQ